MLIWNWDDGNSDNVEGTVWLRSYSTGNETTFNIQLAGDTYESIYTQWEETLDAAYNEPPPPNAFAPAAEPIRHSRPAPILGTSFGIRLIRQRDYCSDQTRICERMEEQAKYNNCSQEWGATGSGCLWRETKRKFREEIVGTAIGMGVGFLTGWGIGGLRGAAMGAAAGLGEEFAENVIHMSVSRVDQLCLSEAQVYYDRCIGEPTDIGTCMWSRGCSSQPKPR